MKFQSDDDDCEITRKCAQHISRSRMLRIRTSFIWKRKKFMIISCRNTRYGNTNMRVILCSFQTHIPCSYVRKVHRNVKVHIFCYGIVRTKYENPENLKMKMM